jgi:hypothetical protein
LLGSFLNAPPDDGAVTPPPDQRETLIPVTDTDTDQPTPPSTDGRLAAILGDDHPVFRRMITSVAERRPSLKVPTIPHQHAEEHGAMPGFTESDIQQTIEEANKFADIVYDRYRSSSPTVPSREDRDSDIARFNALQKRLAAIVGSDELPQGPAGKPGYADNGRSASLYLYHAFVNSGLLGPKNIPEPLMRGFMEEP